MNTVFIGLAFVIGYKNLKKYKFILKIDFSSINECVMR